MDEGIKRNNYRKLYPNVNEEIYKVLEQSDRKIKYCRYDLKTERCSIDYEKGKVTYIPSREDSFDRLEEQNCQFSDLAGNIEDRVIQKILIVQMKNCLALLSDEERSLLSYVFVHGGIYATLNLGRTDGIEGDERQSPVIKQSLVDCFALKRTVIMLLPPRYRHRNGGGSQRSWER